jgi:hypothetical protein
MGAAGTPIGDTLLLCFRLIVANHRMPRLRKRRFRACGDSAAPDSRLRGNDERGAMGLGERRSGASSLTRMAEAERFGLPRRP